MPDQFDLVALGNAIVDLIVQCDESVLKRLGCPKGHMVLVNSSGPISAVYKQLGRGTEIAGGSCANTAVGIASLGGRTAFVGRVGRDEFGHIFVHDIRSIGVTFANPMAASGKETSRSLILVTPDGQRTMCTFLGTAELDASSVDLQVIDNSRILLIEGYLFDKLEPRAACRLVAARAAALHKQVAFSLPDSLCIDRHRAEFVNFIRAKVQVLIANEAEVKALYRTKLLEDAVRQVARDCSLTAITLGERGSIIVSKGKISELPAERVRAVVDKTGAGDLYAAGFLYGLSQGMPPEAAARIGGFAAADIICQFGARPMGNLGRMARQRGIVPSFAS